MTTNSNQPSRTVLLNNVRDCARNEGKAGVNVVTAIRDAGGNQDDVRLAFRIGHVMGTLNLKVEDARRVVTKLASPDVKDLGKRWTGRRSAEQQAAVRNADQAWSRALKRAGLKSTSPKAGNKNATKRKNTKAKSTDKANVITLGPITVTKGTGRQPAVREFKTEREGVEAFERLAAAALLLANKNITHLPGDLRQAVSTFHHAIMAVCKAERGDK